MVSWYGSTVAEKSVYEQQYCSTSVQPGCCDDVSYVGSMVLRIVIGCTTLDFIGHDEKEPRAQTERVEQMVTADCTLKP